MDAAPRRTSLRDVADAAGVSPGTASRVLARRGDYAPATRRAVLDAAERLGYDRTSTPRGRKPHTDPRLIELVIGGVGNPWSNEVVTGAHERAFELGYDVVLTRERDDPADDWPARIAERRSSGVVLALVTPTRRQLDLLAGFAVPAVLLDPQAETDVALASVGATNHQGGLDAGRHLVAQGYEGFAFATGRLRYRFGRARERGFREAVALELPGATVDLVDAEWSGVSRAAVERLLALSDGRRLGIFAFNDDLAAILAAALRDAGRRIPEDVGIVGFDDNPRLRTAALTTVRQPIAAMAARAVELVDALRRGDPVPHRHVELPTELIVRRTTGAPGPRTLER
ncbi:LacI family DNA-binding transcriptional regulator [Microbacterium sp. SS28]|uniref:LacI family DNA-binding transcriptional regulator n=1 Tax=Microbacterium sp. SS28 TaxID=2919948 RepID=UPI001FA9C0E8|nr:LacI family DNA-binding transcriptional regulator [Microbacterium sp. SS28]